jgi:hypothetical protein
MSQRLGPIKRDEFVRRLRMLGFSEVKRGTRHAFMTYADFDLHIPSYDEWDVSMHQEMLREVQALMGRKISRREWQSL